MKLPQNQRKTTLILLPLITLTILSLGTYLPIEDNKNAINQTDSSSDQIKTNQVENISNNQSSSSNHTSNQIENASTNKSIPERIETLSEHEYYVTQENGTEPAFQNEYYDNKRPGIYVDVVSGAPLFSSKHKYDSGTGWPAFYKPLEPSNIIERKDPGPLGVRTEVASKEAKTHLGHIFEDGPEDKTGLRYCINSASLEFIPANQLEQKGYGKYTSMFNNTTQGEDS